MREESWAEVDKLRSLVEAVKAIAEIAPIGNAKIDMYCTIASVGTLRCCCGRCANNPVRPTGIEPFGNHLPC